MCPTSRRTTVTLTTPTRELLREIARSNEMTIHAGAINRDHVHMLISRPNCLCRERFSISRGRLGTNCFRNITLCKRYWGQHLWARGYWVASSAHVTDEVWMKYIEDQKPEEPDDHFQAV